MYTVDNVSPKLVQNPEFHQRNKHIEMRYYFVQDLYKKEMINIKYVKSEDKCTDVFWQNRLQNLNSS